MRLTRLLAAAVAVPATLFAQPAHAFTPVFAGTPCVSAVGANGTAVVQGGPYAGLDADHPAELAEVYVICTLQVGGTGYASDPDAVRLESEGDGVAVLAPTAVKLEVMPGDEVFTCTEIWIAASDGHLSVYQDAESGAFVGSQADARCDGGISVPVPLPLCRFFNCGGGPARSSARRTVIP